MNILLFGASGNVGNHILQEASSRGHQVTAASRNPGGLGTLTPNVTSIVADVEDLEAIIPLVDDAEIVIAAIRPPDGEELQLVRLTKNLLHAATSTGTRLLISGGAACLRTPSGLSVLDDREYLPSAALAIAQACMAQMETCQQHPQAPWTYLAPAASLTTGPTHRKYRLGKKKLLIDEQGRSQISLGDLACAVIDEAEANLFDRQVFTAAY